MSLAVIALKNCRLGSFENREEFDAILSPGMLKNQQLVDALRRGGIIDPAGLRKTPQRQSDSWSLKGDCRCLLKWVKKEVNGSLKAGS